MNEIKIENSCEQILTALRGVTRTNEKTLCVAAGFVYWDGGG